MLIYIQLFIYISDLNCILWETVIRKATTEVVCQLKKKTMF